MDIVNDQMNKRIVCMLILKIFESFVEAETHKYIYVNKLYFRYFVWSLTTLYREMNDLKSHIQYSFIAQLPGTHNIRMQHTG